MTQRFSRRRILGLGAATALTGCAYPTLLEPRWLETTHTRVPIQGHASSTARILHLSDLHASAVVPWSLIESAIDTGLAHKPDLICLTGDFITDRKETDTPRYVPILRRLSAAAPTFAVLGNHDGGSWATLRGGHADHRYVDRLLEDAHIELLHNRSRRLDLPQGRLSLAGVGDYWSNEADAAHAMRGTTPSLTTLVLCHNPDAKELLRFHEWHLMLCGHTHGGQIIVPFDGPRYAPVHDKRYVAGLNPFGARHIYTTRGVGNILGVRLGCRPEVTLLDLPLLNA